MKLLYLLDYVEIRYVNFIVYVNFVPFFLEKKSFNFFKDQQPDNQMSVSEKHMTDTEKMVYDQVSAEYYYKK